MDKEIINYYIEIEKHKFHRYKNSIFLKDVDFSKILKSKRISSGEENYKYFIGHIDKITHNTSKTSVYVKSYDSETKWI